MAWYRRNMEARRRETGLKPEASELRHLRYFVAVADEGSATVAAEKRLHTAQSSLSRQLRDLEQEVGTDLFIRCAAAGRRSDGLASSQT